MQPINLISTIEKLILINNQIFMTMIFAQYYLFDNDLVLSLNFFAAIYTIFMALFLVVYHFLNTFLS